MQGVGKVRWLSGKGALHVAEATAGGKFPGGARKAPSDCNRRERYR